MKRYDETMVALSPLDLDKITGMSYAWIERNGPLHQVVVPFVSEFVQLYIYILQLQAIKIKT